MEDLIQVQDQFYILATASRAGERSAVLQHNDTFAVFDPYGDIGSLGTGEQGLYHEGTRYLSRFRLRLNDRVENSGGRRSAAARGRDHRRGE